MNLGFKRFWELIVDALKTVFLEKISSQALRSSCSEETK